MYRLPKSTENKSSFSEQEILIILKGAYNCDFLKKRGKLGRYFERKGF